MIKDPTRDHLTSVGQSGDHDATPCSRGDHEASFDDRDDGQALCLRDHMGCKQTSLNSGLLIIIGSHC